MHKLKSKRRRRSYSICINVMVLTCDHCYVILLSISIFVKAALFCLLSSIVPIASLPRLFIPFAAMVALLVGCVAAVAAPEI